MAEQGFKLPTEGRRYLLGYNGAIAGLMLLAACALSWKGFELPFAIIGGSILSQLLLTLVVWVLRWRDSRQEPIQLFGVFSLSMINLALYLYGTGGHTNPLISLLLVPLALSAVLLRWQLTLTLAMFIVVLYTALTSYFIGLSFAAGTEHHGVHQHNSLMQLHLLGMWLTFAISTILICALVIPLASSVRRQQALIARQREKILQDEQLVSLATFAASSAHKMGTPLSTLSVLVDDFKEVVEGNSDWEEDRDLMAQQISLCKKTLQDMMRKAEGVRQNSRSPVKIGDLAQLLREQFNLLHPMYSLQVRGENTNNMHILADATLEQALLNLLDNAMKASDSAPVMKMKEHAGYLLISIEDSGPGIPESIRQQLGQPFLSSKKEGLGLGLFLSHATIDRLGGELTLQSSNHGTVIEVRLPIYESKQKVL